MAWTDEHRATYRREGGRFPSDLTDAEWDRLSPLIPAAKPGGRPRKTDMRAAMNAIFYLLRTSCPCTICRGRISRRVRRSTTSSASSSARACGTRSGPSCTWPCASVSPDAFLNRAGFVGGGLI
ncbi:transposase [Zavarzinia sp.]|uniref:transposase n=1 Tax=Zavarzinia sp. TaxID=2027920 RepID=UPI003BB57939